ncbi:MAG: hypothetical protein H6698_08825 [Myxococcales bacterium]|nr:hypothetical protein [Myxococcales bacterium]MCB9534388.1 hypothetical protein [Myxococcales bacterium]
MRYALPALLVVALAACETSPSPSDCTDDACEDVGTADGSGGDADATDSDADDVGPTRDLGLDDPLADTETGGDDADTDADVVQFEIEEDVDYPPLAFEIEPADGDTFVPLDVTVTVRFNQPVNPLRLFAANVELSPLHGDAIERLILYDPETYTLRVAPPSSDALLRPVTPYDFRLSQYISSVTGEELGEAFRIRFSTTGFPGREFFRQLATAYAPVIYQQVESDANDTFARIDFDGDLVTTNNYAQRGGAHYGFVYYDVIESVSHYFITYLIYYPSATPRTGIEMEHDFVYVQTVVQKQGSDALGRLRAVLTAYQGSFNVWTPDNSFFSGDAPENGDESVTARIPASAIEEGRHTPIFIESGRHAPCLPTAGTVVGNCSPAGGDTAPFERGTEGLVYRVADASQRRGDAPDDQLTYSLRSFVEEFWALRDRTTGDDAFFGGDVRYSAPDVGTDDAPALRPGDGEIFPSALNSAHPDGTFGGLPFTTSLTNDRGRNGVWFVDPALSFSEALDFDETLELGYCFNPYTNTDVRDALLGCTPTDFVISD